MKKIRIAVVRRHETGNICGFQKFLEMLEQDDRTEIVYIAHSGGKSGDLIGELKSSHPDLLITADLPGFEQCTLTDNIAYNLLDCIQLHLLLHEKLPNEKYLKKQLSIAMFFYCAGKAYHARLLEQYPDLPYLEELSGWQSERDAKAADSNAEILYSVLWEVLRQCGISMQHTAVLQ